MSFIDIVITVVFAGAVIYGFRRGVISQMGSLAALVAGVFVCQLLGEAPTDVAATLMGQGDDATPTARYTASVVGHVVVYLAVFIGVRVIAKGLRSLTHLMLMGPLDRVLGAIFALFEWFMGLSIVLNLWLAIFPSSRLAESSEIGHGVALESVLELAPWLLGMLSSAAGVDIPGVPVSPAMQV